MQKEAEYLHEELMNCLVLNEKYAQEIRRLQTSLQQESASTQALSQTAKQEQALRDQALLSTHGRMAAALEASLEGMKANEGRLLAQLEQLHVELGKAKAEIAERADAGRQIDAMRKEIQRV